MRRLHDRFEIPASAAALAAVLAVLPAGLLPARASAGAEGSAASASGPCAGAVHRSEVSGPAIGPAVAPSCDVHQPSFGSLGPALAWLPESEQAPLSGSEPRTLAVPDKAAAPDRSTRPWISTATEGLDASADVAADSTEALPPRLSARLPEPRSSGIALAGLVMLAAVALRRRTRW